MCSSCKIWNGCEHTGYINMLHEMQWPARDELRQNEPGRPWVASMLRGQCLNNCLVPLMLCQHHAWQCKDWNQIVKQCKAAKVIVRKMGGLCGFWVFQQVFNTFAAGAWGAGLMLGHKECTLIPGTASGSHSQTPASLQASASGSSSWGGSRLPQHTMGK